MISAIDHINIVVSDLERSVKFYTEVLGFEHVSTLHLEGGWIDSVAGLRGVNADVAFIVAPKDELKIELLCYKSPTGESLPVNSLANTVGLRHIAFRVDDIQSSAIRLNDAGVKLLSEPTVVPKHVVPQSPVRKTMYYFLDPDGVLLEIAELKPLD